MTNLDLYTVDGQAIVTHSMIKTFRRCPNQANYKYVHRLKPRVVGKPLERGKWMHYLLEAYYLGEDWKAVHKQLSAKYSDLFDEEKEALGDLPRECLRLMRSYLWHYEREDIEVIGVEETIECELPDGSLYRGKVDMVVRDQYGLWFWDHKTHERLPDMSFRLLDAQSALYLWAGLRDPRYKNELQGFMWNYLRTKPPIPPKLVYKGTSRERLSKVAVDTDYPTMLRGLKELGVPIDNHREQLLSLKRQRWHPDRPQTSPFFARERLEKGSVMLDRVAAEAFHSHTRMRDYDFGISERVVDRSCKFMCSYHRLCTVELFGGNATIERRNFKVGDPHDYYQDEKVK